MSLEGATPTTTGELLAASYFGRRSKAARATTTDDIVEGFPSAIYTRYSTANQLESSTARQLERTLAYAAASGSVVAAGQIYSDEARSGKTTEGREALAALIAAVQRGEIKRVIIEDADRMSRDFLDLAKLFKLLKTSGVELHSASANGPLDWLAVSVNGFLSQEQCRLLSGRMASGRERIIGEGRVPSGPMYGYVRAPGKRGTLRLDEDVVVVIVRAHRLYRQKLTFTQIADIFNDDGVHAPRGGKWSAQAIRRLLKNLLYAGWLVYNRTERSPEAGVTRSKHARLPRNPSTWRKQPMNHLRIVDGTLFSQNQESIKDGRTGRTGPNSRYLLSGRLFCGDCGAPLWAVKTEPDGPKMVGCSNKKVCRVGRNYQIRFLERSVLKTIETVLGDPAGERRYEAAMNLELTAEMKRAATIRENLDRLAGELRHKHDSTWDEALMDGFSDSYVVARRQELQQELDDVERRRAAVPRSSELADLQAAGMEDFKEALRRMADRSPMVPTVEAEFRHVAAIRSLLERIVVNDLPHRGFELEIRGHVANVAAGGPVDVSGDQPTIRTSFRPTPSSFVADTGRHASACRMFRDRTHVMTDAEWKLVSPVVTLCDDPGDTAKDPMSAREVVDAFLFTVLSSVPVSHLRLTFALSPKTVRLVARLRDGEGEAVLAELRKANPHKYGTIDHDHGIEQAKHDISVRDAYGRERAA